MADHRRNLNLPTLPSRAFFPVETHPRPSGTPYSDAPSTIYQQLSNFSFASSLVPPSRTNPGVDDRITPVREPEHAILPPSGQSSAGAMMHRPSELFRRSSVHGMWEKAKAKQASLERSKWAMIAFEYTAYTWLAMFLYFVLVGRPLWKGLTWYMWYVQFSCLRRPGSGFDPCCGVRQCRRFIIVANYSVGLSSPKNLL